MANKKNQELRELYKDPEIVATVESRRLRWVGHVERRGKESLLKKVTDGQTHGTRLLGRLKLRWKDD